MATPGSVGALVTPCGAFHPVRSHAVLFRNCSLYNSPRAGRHGDRSNLVGSCYPISGIDRWRGNSPGALHILHGRYFVVPAPVSMERHHPRDPGCVGLCQRRYPPEPRVSRKARSPRGIHKPPDYWHSFPGTGSPHTGNARCRGISSGRGAWSNCFAGGNRAGGKWTSPAGKNDK